MLPAPTWAANELKIDDLVFVGQRSQTERRSTLHAVRAFYEFWDSGDERFLKAAISDGFTEQTLPECRPQGAQGPAYASRRFRAAVPDLRVRVRKMVIAGNYVTVHMTFTGSFTGRIGDAQGRGQSIQFIATDLLKLNRGRITDNWHIEDNCLVAADGHREDRMI